MRIMLTGAKGQIAQSIKKHKPEDWEMISADSQTVDITDTAAVQNMVRNFEPDIIINCAGYMNLHVAEQERERVFAINAQGVRILAETTAQAGIRFIHLSSDYVFDGQKRVPYTEIDSPNPLSTYAQSKLAGELLALAANPDSTIIRSSWVFSEYGQNFITEILNQINNSSIEVSTDKIGCPTYAGDLARFMIALSQNRQAPRGIFHYCGDKAVNRFEFAQFIMNEAQKHRQTTPKLIALPIQEPENTIRPPYSVLSCEKIRAMGYQPSDWQTALKCVVPSLLTEHCQ